MDKLHWVKGKIVGLCHCNIIKNVCKNHCCVLGESDLLVGMCDVGGGGGVS